MKRKSKKSKVETVELPEMTLTAAGGWCAPPGTFYDFFSKAECCAAEKCNCAAEEEIAPNVLEEAATLIFGERESDYGHPSKNLGNIAALWSAYLDGRPGFDELPVQCHNITHEDVAIMMLLLKVARMIPGASRSSIKRDSVVDAAGYLGLIERVDGLK